MTDGKNVGAKKLVLQKAVMDPSKRSPVAAKTAIEQSLTETKTALDTLEKLMKQVFVAANGVDTSLNTPEGKALKSFQDATVDLNLAMLHRIPSPPPTN